jgi:Uncharacterized protein conserved in bacteria
MEETLIKNHAVKLSKKTGIQIAVVLLIIALAIGTYFAVNYIMQLNEYKKRIAAISISNVDLSKIPDGSYVGSYDAIMIAARVRVDVSDHAITDVKLLYHKNERGKKAEVIVNEIKTAQSLKVDTISGATNSSKVILKAAQNALDTAARQ